MAETPFERRLLGQTLANKYRLTHIQGAGYYSVVFVAQQFFCNQFVRPVAIKISRQQGLSEETAPRLFGDAIILARLLAGDDSDTHQAGRRHLVQIHDMGLLPEEGGRAYLVMEYVDGRPLMQHLQAAGKFSIASGVRWFKQICQAMALVHSQGAIHRDLIPENILIDRRGRIRVVDFGLAAYTDPQTGFVPGATGTFCYMAPETMLGRSLPASDVYSIGLVVYELFTGGGPHRTTPWLISDKEDRSKENYRLKTALRYPPPSEFHNEIRNDARWLDAVILRCLDPDPARRFPDAGALLEAIEAGEQGRPIPDPEPVASVDLEAPASRAAPNDDESDTLFREIRRMLARQEYDRVIDRLDIYRPAEWAVLDPLSARTLRILGQAHLRRGQVRQARECLEQLRIGQREKPLLSPLDYSLALSDLVRCYRALGEMSLAQECQEEARKLL
jgi:serine/threonine protein kinase